MAQDSVLYHQSFCLSEQPRQQILFIHGWGMNSGIWSDLVPILVERLPDTMITLVDLPGYGKSAPLEQTATAAGLADALQPLLTPKFTHDAIAQTTIVGWSMGGLVAIELASRCREFTQQLVLVSATPRFVQADDWPDAVEPRFFQQFADSLEKDPRMTLKRFLALLALGSPTARQDLKKIQQQLSLQGEADPRSLGQGLQLLLHEDKREQLSSLPMPVTFISGQRDTLIEIRALEQLSEAPGISLHTITQAGHAPFISHPLQFVDALLRNVH